jgi:hypothetical protein
MKISLLLGAKVVSDEGDELGRVHDVRVRRLGHRNADGYGLRLTGLVIGVPGIRERLGIPSRHRPLVRRSGDFIAWERVIEVETVDGGKTVIRCRR